MGKRMSGLGWRVVRRARERDGFLRRDGGKVRLGFSWFFGGRLFWFLCFCGFFGGEGDKFSLFGSLFPIS